MPLFFDLCQNTDNRERRLRRSRYLHNNIEQKLIERPYVYVYCKLLVILHFQLKYLYVINTVTNISICDMKKHLMIAVVMLSMCTAMKGQTLYDFSTFIFYDTVDSMDVTPLGVFYNVSPNGKYAVGCDNAQMNCKESYLWQSDEPEELQILNIAPTRISTIDVSDNGTIVGSFEDRGDSLDNKAVAYPAYKTLDGDWVTLPVPDNYSEYQAKYNSFAEEARAITPDDKYIAGHVHLIMGYNSTFDYDIVYPTPLLWEKTDTGYVLKATYTALGDSGKSYLLVDGEPVLQEGEVYYKSFFVYDISRDGSMICGVNTAASGGQNPAIIKDGVLIQLFDCGEYGVTDYDYLNFNGGVCNSIDANGNVYGYYVDYDASVKYFVYTNEGELVYYDYWYVCGDEYGNKMPQAIGDISYVQDCSDDGTVIVGGGGTETATGAAVNYPMLYTDFDISGISRIESIKNNVDISYTRGGTLYVNGEYNSVEVFNSSGMAVASGKQGKAFGTAALPTGTYIVKVNTDNGVKTYKIVR